MQLSMASPKTLRPSDWQVDVKFQSRGVLHANASGLLLVPPEQALALVTDTGKVLFA